MKKNKVRIWVHPDFKKAIKLQAAEQGTSVIELSRKINIKKVSVGDMFKRLI